jgi:hypothetical protein
VLFADDANPCSVSFAGASYRAGRAWARASIEVAVAGGSVQLSKDGKVIRVHPIRHDRSRDFGVAWSEDEGDRRTGTW